MSMRGLTAIVVGLAVVILVTGPAAGGTTRYVSPSGTESGGYTTWSTAAKTIQKAVDACANGDVVWVTNGTYVLSSPISITLRISLQSVNGHTGTTIDGGGTTNRVFVVAPNVTIDGFKLTGCRQSSYTLGYGGAIYLSASGMVRNCYVVSNSVNLQSQHGGGICLMNGGIIENCIVRNNTAYQGGGAGIYANGGLVRNCVIEGNSGYTWRSRGGGLLCQGATVRNCLITGNYCEGDYPTDGNGGGGIFCNGGSLVENCTVVSNTANSTGNSDGGGALLVSSTCRNCIVYSNSGNSYPNIANQASTITYTCATPNPSGTGNTANDPAFVNGFHVTTGSPCVDKGTNLAWMVGTTDLDGNPRIANGIVDMGAYEANSTPASGFRIMSADATTDGCLRLIFTTVNGITDYQVECSPDLLSSNWAVLGNPVVALAGSSELVDSNLVVAQRFYRVRGFPPPDTTPPGNVSSLTATPGNGQVSLSWVNPADADFAGVKVLRKTGNYPSSPTDGTVVYSGTGTSTTDTGLANGTPYYYKAFSYDLLTNYASGVTTTATPQAPDTTPPGNVSGFAATGGNARVTLTWTNPTDPDFAGVRIQRKTGGYPSGTTDGSTVYDGGGTNTTDTGLANGTTYYYKAFSHDVVPNYASGSNASATPQASTDTTPPANVTNLISTSGDRQVALRWQNPTDPDFAGVRIQRKTGGYPTSISDGTTVYDGNGTNTTDAGLTNGTAYYYMAFSYDGVPNYAGGVTAAALPSSGSGGTLTTLYAFTGGSDGAQP